MASQDKRKERKQNEKTQPENIQEIGEEPIVEHTPAGDIEYAEDALPPDEGEESSETRQDEQERKSEQQRGEERRREAA